MRRVSPRRARRPAASIALAFMAIQIVTVACQRSQVAPRPGQEQVQTSGKGGAPGSSATGGGGDSGDAGDGTADGAVAGDGSAPIAVIDPGWTGLRRLSDVEYDNTMTDLLGVESGARRILEGFAPDRLIANFDNVVAGQALGDRVVWYYAHAIALTEAAFADPVKRARILTCVPTGPTDDSCARDILRTFGLHAWRRPLTEDEIDDLVRLTRTQQTTTGDFAHGIQQAIVALLASESFLFRIELDPDADTTAVHALSPYELATRLSYLLWSTLPDATLFDLAKSGALMNRDTVRAQVARMLADPRAQAFVRNFAGQWLGFRVLADGPVFSKTLGLSLQTAFVEEVRRFVTMIIEEDRPLTDLLTADVNFVNDRLAAHYQMAPPGSPDALMRVSVTTDSRRGLLGMSAPLTTTSRETETVPTWRGQWVLERLLCAGVAPDPQNPPRPPGAARPNTDSINAMPACAGCHRQTDAIGLAFEIYDELGRARFVEGQAPMTSPRGRLPDGTTFDNLPHLGDLIAANPRFWRCATEKALTYALGREMGLGDTATIFRIAKAAEASGLTMRGLLGAVVVDDVFRTRRGIAP